MVSLILFQEGLQEAGAEPAGRGAAVCFLGILLGANICFFDPNARKKKGSFKKKIYFIFN
jgi:hypothetical protein